MHLDDAETVGRGCLGRQLVVVGERLHRRLCNQTVQAMREARRCDSAVRVIGCEDDGDLRGQCRANQMPPEMKVMRRAGELGR